MPTIPHVKTHFGSSETYPLDKKRWWPTTEQSLAALLRRDGHRVILVNPSK